MGGNFRIARLAGIPIELNVSWFLIFFLVAWSLSAQVFPSWEPGLATATYWLLGTTAALVLFGSLLLHELAHSLMSRRYGIEVRRITLFLFGGVSEAPEEMPSAKAEFWIAIVGPLTSFALGLAFFAMGWAAGAAGAGNWLVMGLNWLGVLNVILGAFNLVPGYPLDGGRVLRSAVWAWTKDMRKATRWASNGGKAFAAILMGIGLARLFGGNWFGGFWLLFLGWLLFQAAQGSYTQLVLKQSLNRVRVGEIMTREVETIGPDESLRRAVEGHFMRHSYGGYPVVEDGRVLGFLSRAEVKRTEAAAWDGIRVREAMIPIDQLPAASPDEPVGDLLERMAGSDLGRLPVLEQGRLVGLISQTDIMRHLAWTEQGQGKGFLG